MIDVDGRTAIGDLGQLNAALALLNPDLTPPPAGGGGGQAPLPYVLPLTGAEFAGPPAAAALNQAIARAPTVLWDHIRVQEIVDDVNVVLANPVPVPAPVIAPAEIVFEDHGYKHSGGRPHIKVKQGGAQWSLSVEAAQRLMEGDIRRMEPDLRRNERPNIQGVTSYYYTGRAEQNIGSSSGARCASTRSRSLTTAGQTRSATTATPTTWAPPLGSAAPGTSRSGTSRSPWPQSPTAPDATPGPRRDDATEQDDQRQLLRA